MTLMQRYFALRRHAPFSGLPDRDRMLVAEVAEARPFEAGRRLIEAGRPLRRLYLVIDGELRFDRGGLCPALLGVGSLLFDHELDEGIVAGENGATCITLEKGHFYTLIYQCPALLLGLLERVPSGQEGS